MPGSLYVTELRDFYETPLGALARRLIRRQIRNLWPSVNGEHIVGLGYATPYLRTFHQRTLVSAFMPAHQGVTMWPPEGPYKAALVDETNLPLADCSIEKMLLVHGLELSDHPHEMLNEAWRVLKPEGQLLAIVPNRRGLWAGPESTPFGHGRPYSRTQLENILKEVSFRPLEWHHALCTPPLRWRVLTRSAVGIERIGLRLWPAIAGVNIVTARKIVYHGIPTRKKSLLPTRLIPVPSAVGLHKGKIQD